MASSKPYFSGSGPPTVSTWRWGGKGLAAAPAFLPALGPSGSRAAEGPVAGGGARPGSAFLSVFSCPTGKNYFGLCSAPYSTLQKTSLPSHPPSRPPALSQFGVESGAECNTRLLRERGGWGGLLMDGGFDAPAIGLHRAFVTPANINPLLDKYSVPAEFDLLSIDVRGG